MEAERPFPEIRQVVLDCTDVRALAEFYRELLGLRYREGDESPDQAEKDWLVLRGPNRNSGVAFQQVDELRSRLGPIPRLRNSCTST